MPKPATKPKNPIDEALSHFHDCDYDAAEGCFRGLLEQAPDNVQARYHYALLLNETKRYKEAGTLIKGLMETENASPEYLAALGLAVHRQERFQQANQLYEEALTINADSAVVYRNHALMFMDLKKFGKAYQRLKKSVALDPDDAGAQNGLAIACLKCSLMDEAEEASRKAIDLRPKYEAAHANLLGILNGANKLSEATEHLKITRELFPEGTICTFNEAIILRRNGKFKDAISILESGRYPKEDPVVVMEASRELGLSYDRDGQVDKAFAQFEKFNKLAIEAWNINAQRKKEYQDELDQCKKLFTPEWVKSWTSCDVSPEENTPAFIISFPRSGTTLLQYILDAHPSIYAAEEIPAMDMVMKGLQNNPGPYPACLADLDEEQILESQARYFQAHKNTRQWQDCDLLIDKYPLATAYIGMIHRLFPQAKLIFAQRHPCDAILSCFMQFFQPNKAMVHLYDMGDIVNLYCNVMDLWRQYEEVLPLDVHYLRYEDVVDDFKSAAKDVIKFLDLPWDDAVLDYQKKFLETATSRTPSFEQVSEKIYDRSRYRWERYRKHFEPYLEQLEPYITGFGYRP